MSNSLREYVFNVAMIGDAGVGKSTLMNRYIKGRFFERAVDTLGVDYATKSLVVDDCRIKVNVYDTAGQERFRTITHSYYRNANGLILVYDITNYESFVGLGRWLHDVQMYSEPDVYLCLVGTKKDMEKKREVTEEQAKTFSAKYPCIVHVVETSAKENENIDEVFEKIVGALKNKYEACPTPVHLHHHQLSSSIILTSSTGRTRKPNICTWPSCCG